MIYLGTASSELIRKAMSELLIGQMITPISGNVLVEGAIWAYDNGCFSGELNEAKWMRKMTRYADAPNCKFAVVPDKLCDAKATDELWPKYASIVKELGYKAAYVTQNGCTDIPEDADAVFTGGDNDWKFGPDAQKLIEKAKSKGLWCHMGRVNSRKRIRYAKSCGYDSVDGTLLAFRPDKNLECLIRWMNEANQQPQLEQMFDGKAQSPYAILK